MTHGEPFLYRGHHIGRGELGRYQVEEHYESAGLKSPAVARVEVDLCHDDNIIAHCLLRERALGLREPLSWDMQALLDYEARR